MRVTEYTMELNHEKIPSLIKEKSMNYAALKTCKHPRDIWHMMREIYRLDKRAEEHLYMLAYATNMSLLGVFEISHGTVDSSMVTPREILIRALAIGAVNIVLVHNHPSGDVHPSKADIDVTARIREASQIVGITLCDHIIIGDSMFSFFENGMK